MGMEDYTVRGLFRPQLFTTETTIRPPGVKNSGSSGDVKANLHKESKAGDAFKSCMKMLGGGIGMALTSPLILLAAGTGEAITSAAGAAKGTGATFGAAVGSLGFLSLFSSGLNQFREVRKG